MGLRKLLVVMLGLALVVLLPCLCAAQSYLTGLGQQPAGFWLTNVRGFHWGLGLKKYANSFISWEGGDQYGTDPAFRLEYPLDQWFGGLVATFVEPNLAVRAEFWTNMNSETGPRFQDSDWGPTFPRFVRVPTPSGKVFMTEADCRLHRGRLIDLSMSLPLLARSFGFSPLFGYRYKSFDFRTYDRFTTSSIGIARPFVPGDFVLWSVKLRDYYTGALSEIAFDFGGALSQISVKLQADAALTKAEAVDNHVQWPYSEIVFDTKGSAWHVSLETRLAVANMAVLGCAVDFERTHTHGHRHTSNPYDRKGWNSEETRIWSDQLWFTIHGELIF